MNNFFKNQILLICFLSEVLQAQTQSKDTLISAMIKAISAYKNYSISYTIDSKSQSSEDTSSLFINATFTSLARKPICGYLEVRDLKKNDNYALAFNTKNLIFFEEKSKSYSQISYKENKSLFTSKVDNNVYLPFTKQREYYSKFKIIEANSYGFTIVYLDTTFDKSIISKSIISVSKSNFLPIGMKEWNWYDGGVDFKSYRLVNVQKIPEKNSKLIQNKAISLMKYYKSFLNGDSIWEAYLSKFNILKIGDSIRNFKGYIHGSSDSIEITNIMDSIIVIDFAYSTCGYCAATVPKLNLLNNLYKNKGVKIISVDPYKSDWTKLDKFIDYFKVNYPILLVNKEVEMDYGIEGYPMLFIFKNDILKFINRGAPDNLEEILKSELDKLL